MSKLKQSIAVLRQIPEHIRTNYPLFVEFIKIYYEYLEETQQQDLEGLHDIDKVTDEFVDRFRSELSKNFPIHLASDKRLILKHLREFYLSRGSEASYKFLFRTLFGKEASLYYPSRQMLRVSDGRWTQDVSIFVREIGAKLEDPSVAIGNFTYITNKSGKVIRAVVKNISKYSEGIYEVSISREYADEIDIGSISQDETGTYRAVVLPCPSTVKVFKGGKGFSAGDIFALKTQLGRGCVVKVTEVDSEGSIRKIQVMQFGLDYETKFYSYLSSKDDIAFEYVHPLKIGAGSADTKTYIVSGNGNKTYNVQYLIEAGNPLLVVEVFRNNALVTPTPSYTATNGTSVTINNLQDGDVVQLYGITSKGVAPVPSSPAYNEKSGGFVDYGWASKQTYFFYDPDIPIGDVTRASDRYFADSSYVGEIVQQFYNEATTKVVDEDIAIIEIDLGAVARYPGYYSTSDGFISDQIYIQDGNYYQAFSYVIRVEEELRRYADIIKALVHPAGLKLFSEYEIFNQLNLSYTQPRSLLSLTLPLFDRPATNTIVDDRGVGYTEYDVNVIQGEVTSITPSLNASPVYANQGKIAYHSLKKILDTVSEPLSRIDTKFVYKAISDSITDRYVQYLSSNPDWWITRNYDETISKYGQKALTDAFEPSVTAVEKQVDKNLNDDQNQSDGQSKDVEKPFTDSQDLLDAPSKHVQKPTSETQEQTDSQAKLVDKSVVETQEQADSQVKSVDKSVIEAQEQTDSLFNNPNKILSDSLSFIEEILIAYGVFPSDTLESLSDALSSFFAEKLIQETQSILEEVSNNSQKPLDESITLSDSFVNGPIKNFTDSISSITQDYLLEFAKNPSDSISLTEQLAFAVDKLHADLLEAIDIVGKRLYKEYSESITLNDSILLARAKILEETMSALDAYVLSVAKTFNESAITSETFNQSYAKSLAESINTTMSGRLWLNPYNLEGYFAEDYFSYTSLT